MVQLHAPAAYGRQAGLELRELGAAATGVSTQRTAYQAEVAARLFLGFPLLS